MHLVPSFIYGLGGEFPKRNCLCASQMLSLRTDTFYLIYRIKSVAFFTQSFQRDSPKGSIDLTKVSRGTHHKVQKMHLNIREKSFIQLQLQIHFQFIYLIPLKCFLITQVKKTLEHLKIWHIYHIYWKNIWACKLCQTLT